MVSPLELKNKEFSVRLRGYDRNEVDDFLSIVIKDYESLYRFFRKSADSAQFAEDEEAPARAFPEQARQAGQEAVQKVQAAAVENQATQAEDAPANPAKGAPDRAVMEILEMARAAAEDARRVAASEAQSMISDAKRKADLMAAEAESKLRGVERRLADLAAQESAIRARMKGLVEVYRQLMEDFEATSAIDYNL